MLKAHVVPIIHIQTHIVALIVKQSTGKSPKDKRQTGLVVMGGDSCSICGEFESQHQTLR